MEVNIEKEKVLIKSSHIERIIVIIMQKQGCFYKREGLPEKNEVNAI